jgi:endonuclease G
MLLLTGGPQGERTAKFEFTGALPLSAERTDSPEHNKQVSAMSNIIPQSKDNNEGVWEHMDAYCRELAEQGNELLIICGSGKFNGQHLNGPDPVEVPADTWKIVVEVPSSPGSALSRISAPTTVIAVDIPNVEGARNDPWPKYLES